MKATFLNEVSIATKIPFNHNGRDFVIGDIHGHIDLVYALLKAVSFNDTVDRLFLVGDLVDRGPNSLDTLRLLLKPYVYAVMGNHEEILLCAAWNHLNQDKRIPLYFECMPDDVIVNGGQWIFQGDFSTNWFENLISKNDDFLEIIAAVSKLPLVLSVGEGESRFNLTHSEFFEHWTDERIDDLPLTLPLEKAGKSKINLSCWERNIFNKRTLPRMPAIQEGLSTTFTGHTVGVGIRSARSHVCIDTGAYVSVDYFNDGVESYGDFGLTIINAKTMEYSTIDGNNKITSAVFKNDILCENV